MAANSSRIKGITIELDGETTGLQKALSNVTKESIDIQKELKDVERLLKFDPGNIEALAQKQQLLSRQIENTSNKLEQLKNAQEQVDRQFSNGEINETQYRAFRREIEYTERELNNLNQSLRDVDNGASISSLRNDFSQVSDAAEDAQDSVKDLGGELTSLAAGAAAGIGIGEIIEKSLDISNLNTKLLVSMELDEGSVDIVKNAISTVETYGIDAEAALEGVRRQWALNKDASDESNAAVVQGAATIVATYGDVDFTELIQETNEISKNLGISNEDAIALTYSLLKMGFPPDQLDIITEYGSQLARVGYTAQEIQGIMAAGVKTGTWNIDVLLDGLKEGRIVLTEFGQGVDKATIALLDGTNISADQLQVWGKSVANGGEEGKKAMTEVATAIASISDKTKQNEVGTKIFGTLWEENGTKITDTLLGVNSNLMSAEANQNNLNAATNDLDSDPAIKMQKAISDLTTALAPVLIVIADIIGKIADWISNNPTLSATIIAIVTTLGILIGIMTALAPIITAISTAAGVLGISVSAIAWPVLAVIAAIAALIAIGVLLYQNWDTIKEKASELWIWVQEKFQGFLDWLSSVFSTDWTSAFGAFGNVLNEFFASISPIFDAAKQIFSGIVDFVEGVFTGDWSRAWKGIVNIFGGIMDGLGAVIKAPLNGIIALINMAIDGLNSISVDIPDWVPGVGGSTFGVNLGKIPYLAKGGVVNSPTLAMVGEAGREAVMPLENNTGWITQLATQIAGVLDNRTSDTVLYAEIPISLDGKLIANKTTPIVLSNISRSQNSRNMSKGRG